jgi:peptidoglycan/LPS O-acetylase OafA/YrhL
MSASAPSAATELSGPARSAEPAWRRFFALDLLDNRYAALHGARTLAIISVVQYHVTGMLRVDGYPVPPLLADSSLRIFFGMDLFFILSGFLIGSILLRSLEVSGTQNIRRFYLRRVFRTFPSYYVVLTVLALAFPLTADQRKNLPWEYLYATNFFPMHRLAVVMDWGWSLALEEQFYLTVPLLFAVLYKLKSDRVRIGVLAALWASGLFVRLGIYLHGHLTTERQLLDALYFQTYTRYDTLVLGILLAFVHKRHAPAIRVWLRQPANRARLAIPSLALLWVVLRPDLLGPEHAAIMQVFAWGTLTSLMYLPALVLLLHDDGWVQRFLGWSGFRRLATIGYGVYLVHIPLIQNVVMPLVRPLAARNVPMVVVWILALTVAMGVSWVVGYILHVLVEKPSLWIRERLAA